MHLGSFEPVAVIIIEIKDKINYLLLPEELQSQRCRPGQAQQPRRQNPASTTATSAASRRTAVGAPA